MLASIPGKTLVMTGALSPTSRRNRSGKESNSSPCVVQVRAGTYSLNDVGGRPVADITPVLGV